MPRSSAKNSFPNTQEVWSQAKLDTCQRDYKYEICDPVSSDYTGALTYLCELLLA